MLVLADGRIVEDRVATMIRVATKALAQRKLRTALTVLAIVVGVGMVSAALVLGDSMKKGADSLSASSYRGTDAVVSAKTPFTVFDPDGGRHRRRSRRAC